MTTAAAGTFETSGVSIIPEERGPTQQNTPLLRCYVVPIDVSNDRMAFIVKVELSFITCP